MKIGIDCRLYGPRHTGIGRYVQNLVENLLEQDRKNEYILFVNNNSIDNLTIQQFNNLTIVKTNIKHYSLKEQLFLPGIIKKNKVDLMHFPHFNVPVFYQGRYVVTIHDLIKHSSKGFATTTRFPLLYWVKYLGYKFVFKQAVKRAERIITPSNFVKDELVGRYGLDVNKLVVTYEGVDDSIKYQVLSIKGKEKILAKYDIKKPYLLYVGSVYPHKNIERLIEAVKLLNQDRIASCVSRIALVIVCARNVFSKRLDKFVEQSGSDEFVRMTGFVPDEELAVLYQEAEVFVFPTLSEGFGLPGLEAMSVGCPVICSDIPVLKEVYKDSALYFNPLDSKDITEKISQLLVDKKLQEKLKSLGFQLAQTYSWQKTARETLGVYDST